MSNDTTGLIRQGIAAFKAGDRAQAARLFHQVTQSDPQNQMGWLWLAGCLDDDNEKRHCLERARDINPQSKFGQRAAGALNKMSPIENTETVDQVEPFPKPIQPVASSDNPVAQPVTTTRHRKKGTVWLMSSLRALLPEHGISEPKQRRSALCLGMSLS
jgi:hypothetical protein